MKFILAVMISFNAYSSPDLKAFFSQTSEALNICKDASFTLANGNRRTPLKFLRHHDQSIFYVSTIDDLSTVREFDYNAKLLKEFRIEGEVTNINFYKNEVIILSRTAMYILDKTTKKLLLTKRTLPNHLKFEKDAFAQGVYVLDDIYYIAHGTYGISPYDRRADQYLDLIEPKIEQPHHLHKSMITDIAGVDNRVYLSMDDSTLLRDSKAFEGIIILDLITGLTEKAIAVNQKREAYYMPKLTLDENNLVITNLHLQFVHKIKKLESYSFMRPQKRVWKYKPGKLLGRGIVSRGEIYGCFLDEKKNITKMGHTKL